MCATVGQCPCSAFFRMPLRTFVKLGNALLASVPKKHRKKLAKAFDGYETAEITSSLVREQVAYLVGIEMGRQSRKSDA